MNRLEMKRIWIFLGIAFGLAWAISLVVYLTGGYVDNPLAIPLIAGLVMPAPAIANLLTRWLTGEGWDNLWLRPRLKRAWPFWLIAWFGTGLLVMIGIGIFFMLYPHYFDRTLAPLAEMMPPEVPVSLQAFLIIGILQGILISPLVNGLPVFGEEFGWRAYLQPKLMPLGGRKALLLMGVIWGIWHAPIILMGHNYGLDYTGAPFLGPLAMIWFTTMVGIFLGWLTLRAGSVWPAVIGHAVLNGLAMLPSLMLSGEPNLLLGPTSSGLIGGMGFTLVAAWILWRGNLSIETKPAAVPTESPVEAIA